MFQFANKSYIWLKMVVFEFDVFDSGILVDLVG